VSVWLHVLLASSCAMMLAGVSSLVFHLSMTPAAVRPTLGARGLNRTNALRRGGPFAVAEPVVRVLAAWIGVLPLERARTPIRRSLLHSGQYLGLSEDELMAMCGVCGLGLGVAGALVCQVLLLPSWLALCALCVGLTTPWFRVLAVGRARERSVSRGLPGAVELAAMCMSAGLDFPGSLRQITDSATDPTEPVIEEFSRVLQELDLGHTRRNAIEGFAARVPTDQVREFVNSVVQAEAKGSPLASVLTIQAQTQRLRRSVAAEETAAEAALMLLGPMTLIFLCVIVLLLGPVVVRFMTGGFGPS
jgi:tight adherence protein C